MKIHLLFTPPLLAAALLLVPPAADPAAPPVTLLPVSSTTLFNGTVVTDFGNGIRHAGGPVKSVTVVDSGTWEVAPADGGYKSPKDYAAAGRSLVADLNALGSNQIQPMAAANGTTVESGCMGINTADFNVTGCYKRVLAQTQSDGGEILGETFQVTGSTKKSVNGSAGITRRLSGQLRQDWSQGRDYFFEWNPGADQEFGNCTTRTYSLDHAGIGYSSSQISVCPEKYVVQVQNDSTNGSNFRNEWQGSRTGNLQSAGAITYRWSNTPAGTTVRGNMTFRVSMNGVRDWQNVGKSCVGHNYTCT